MRITKLMMLHRLLDKAGEGGSDAGGTGTGQGTDTGAPATGADNQASEEAAAAAAATDDGKPAAKPQGGLSDSDAKLVKDMMRHKSRAKELETELAKASESLKKFEGIDPVKVRELLKAQQEEELRAAESRGEYDRILKQMADRHKEESAALAQTLEAERGKAGSLQAQIAELTVGNSFNSSKFVSEDLTLTSAKARVIYGNHFEFKDGKVVGYDKPIGASERTVLVDSAGETLSFDAALRNLVENDPDRDQLIRTKAKPGAASSTTLKGAKAATNAAASASGNRLSPAEKIAAGLKALANG